MKKFLKYSCERSLEWLKNLSLRELFGNIFSISVTVFFIGLLIFIPITIIAEISNFKNDNAAIKKLEAYGWSKQKMHENDSNTAELLVYKRLDIKYGIGNWKVAVTNIGDYVLWKELKDNK